MGSVCNRYEDGSPTLGSINTRLTAPMRVFISEPAVADLPQARAHLFQVEELHTHSHPFNAI